MDDDVKLSMNNAHEISMTKTLVIGALAAIVMTSGTCSYVNKINDEAEIQKTRSDADKARAEADKARDDRALFEMWGKPAPASSK